MSRSYKKPYHTIACCGRKEVKHAKADMNRQTRRWLDTEEDTLSEPSMYKKYIHSWQWHPGDGKTYNPKWVKAWRK